MSDLGQLLIKARNEKGITIEDLQETTKIRKSYLEAIEEGNYKKLPGNFYVRAFIKSYAEAVGLDPDEVLRLYKNVIPPTNYEQNIEPARRTRSSNAASEKLSNIAVKIVMWLFILLILGIIYYYIDSKYNAANNRQSIDPTPITDKLDKGGKDTGPVVNKTALPATPTATPSPPPAIVTLVKSEPRLDTYSISNSSKLIIQIKFISNRCWFQINKDSKNGEIIETGEINKDNLTRNWELEQSAYLNIGRGDAVEITVNGTIINTGDKPNSKKMQFDLLK